MINPCYLKQKANNGLAGFYTTAQYTLANFNLNATDPIFGIGVKARVQGFLSADLFMDLKKGDAGFGFKGYVDAYAKASLGIASASAEAKFDFNCDLYATKSLDVKLSAKASAAISLDLDLLLKTLTFDFGICATGSTESGFDYSIAWSDNPCDKLEIPCLNAANK